MQRTRFHLLSHHNYALLCMLWLVIVADEEHSSTRRAAFSIAQSDDATTSRIVVASLQSQSDLACSQKCLRNEKCKFKIYHVETKKCELLASIYEKDFMDEKAIPFKKEEILHKNDGLCKSATSIGCSENCECVQIWRFGEPTYTCNCIKQGVYESCSLALKMNEWQQGIYAIKFNDLKNEVELECIKSPRGYKHAIFRHNSEILTHVEGYENPGSYVKHFTYELDLNIIISIINQSRFCKQHVRADCYHARMTGYTWIKGRNGTKLEFWGGGPSNSTGCACGVTNSCADRNEKCNCDKNDPKWRVDKGDVKEKNVLPIMGIAVGDTGNNSERFRYTIGPLLCTN